MCNFDYFESGGFQLQIYGGWEMKEVCKYKNQLDLRFMYIRNKLWLAFRYAAFVVLQQCAYLVALELSQMYNSSEKYESRNKWLVKH